MVPPSTTTGWIRRQQLPDSRPALIA
jgi:hypothetical protein